MNTNKMSATLAMSMVVLSFPTLVFGEGQVDNTKINKRDQSTTEVSADNQSQEKSDVELTREIRKAVVAQKDFSTYAKNVKIITNVGQVTLKGPVKSIDEKNKIEELAKQVAGNSRVTNQIQIKE